MSETLPVHEIRGRFADEIVAREVADALNRWFRWILDGSEAPLPTLFEPLGVETGDYAWVLEEDVDWALAPHARTLGDEVRISLETHDTWQHLAGLLRRLGAHAVEVLRDL